jgi:hypothetical protein
MFFRHAAGRDLVAYHDGALEPKAARRVERHLAACARCRAEYETVAGAAERLRRLPASAAPDALWDRIDRALDAAAPPPHRRAVRRTPALPLLRRVAIAAVLLGGAAGSWRALTPPRPAPPAVITGGSWPVTHLAGTVSAVRLRSGEWLETDATSRARVEVGGMGRVEVGPGSRLRLGSLEGRERRLTLERGTLSARIDAPPRLFLVETPSALAVDLGCAYTLRVDARGDALLRVTSGAVALEHGARESLIPEGAVCATRRGVGPGTPFWADAPAALQGALRRFDFGGGSARDLRAALAAARPRDTLTLWHLLARAPETERARVFDRLAGFAPPPDDVRRKDILALSEEALLRWKDELEAEWWP